MLQNGNPAQIKLVQNALETIAKNQQSSFSADMTELPQYTTPTSSKQTLPPSEDEEFSEVDETGDNGRSESKNSSTPMKHIDYQPKILSDSSSEMPTSLSTQSVSDSQIDKLISDPTNYVDRTSSSE